MSDIYIHGRVKACRTFTRESSHRLCELFPGIFLEAQQVATCFVPAGKQKFHVIAFIAYFYFNVQE